MFSEEEVLTSWQLAVNFGRLRYVADQGGARQTVICEPTMTVGHDGVVRCEHTAGTCQNGNDPGRPTVGTDDDLGGMTCLIAYCVVRGWVGSASRMTVVLSSLPAR